MQYFAGYLPNHPSCIMHKWESCSQQERWFPLIAFIHVLHSSFTHTACKSERAAQFSVSIWSSSFSDPDYKHKELMSTDLLCWLWDVVSWLLGILLCQHSSYTNGYGAVTSFTDCHLRLTFLMLYVVCLPWFVFCSISVNGTDPFHDNKERENQHCSHFQVIAETLFVLSWRSYFSLIVFTYFSWHMHLYFKPDLSVSAIINILCCWTIFCCHFGNCL